MKSVILFAVALTVVAAPALAGSLLRFGVMTDTHVGETKESCARVRQALELFKREGVDLVVNCGDIADRFSPSGYRALRETMSEVFPDKSAAPAELYAFAWHDAWGFDKTLKREDTRLAFDAATVEVRKLLGVPHEPHDLVVVRDYPFVVIPQYYDKDRYRALLRDARRRFPGKPIFVVDHVPSLGKWGGAPYEIGPAVSRHAILKEFPEAIQLCGHTHGDIGDDSLLVVGEYAKVNFGCLQHYRKDGKTVESFGVGVVDVCEDEVVVRRFDVRTGSELSPNRRWRVPVPRPFVTTGGDDVKACVPIRILSRQPGALQHFFDKSPISPSGRYLAYLRLPYADRRAEPGDVAEVFLTDLRNGREWRVAETRAWEHQVGACVMWGSTDEELFYNDLRPGEWQPFLVRLNPLIGVRREFPGGAFVISPDGKRAAGYNLKAVRRMNFYGYGAAVPESEMPVNASAPEEDGLYVIDLETGERSLLKSIAAFYAEALSEAERRELADAASYGFQVKWSPDGEWLLFAVVQALNGEAPGSGKARWRRMVFSCRQDGSETHLALPWRVWSRGGHHFNFHPDSRTVTMNLTGDDGKLKLKCFDVVGSEPKLLCGDVAGSGHPSVSPDGRYLVTDAYRSEGGADADGRVPLRLVRLRDGREVELARVNTAMPEKYADGEFRCDPHPAWSRDGKTITANAVVKGVRCVIGLDVSRLLDGDRGAFDRPVGTSDRVVVRPEATREALVNPGMGWVYYHFDNANWNYGAETATGDTLDWFPGVSTVYFRLPWSDLEPEEGVFRWDVIDTVAQPWIAAGKQIAFRFTCNESSYPWAVPEWLPKSGCKGRFMSMKLKSVPAGFELWEPEWDDPVFLAKYGNFLAAAARKWNGNPAVAFIDVGSLGMWGEGHTCFTTDLPPERMRELALVHAKLTKRHFPDTPVVISDDVSGGWNTEPDDPCMRAMRELGIGLRDDSIMVSRRPYQWFHGDWARKFAAQGLPVVVETRHFYAGEQKNCWYEGGLLDSTVEYQASFQGIHWWPKEFLELNRAEVDRVNLRLGYRFHLKEASWPREVALGGKCEIRSTWSNAGVAAPGEELLACWTLLDARKTVAWTSVDFARDFRALPPTLEDGEKPETLTSVVRFGWDWPSSSKYRAIGLSATHHDGSLAPHGPKVPTLAPGEYDLCVSIGKADGTPRIALPLKGQVEKTRRYLLGKIVIQGGGF